MIISMLVFNACHSDSSSMMNSKASLYYGEMKAFGSDSIKSWVKTDDNGNPASIGVSFKNAAFASLEKDSEMMTMLMLPQTTGMSMMMAMPFDHVEVDWVPNGDPVPPYNKAHLDCHFFTMSMSDQMGMMGGRDTTNMNMMYLPSGYMMDSVSEEGMGVHCMDTTSKEFHGQPFDHSFVYGFYHGNMAFMETMCAKSFLDTKVNFTTDVKQPQAFKMPGYYPMKYSISYDPATTIYSISIDNLHSH